MLTLSSNAPVSANSASSGGRIVYAVGDIHGRLDLLRRLIGAISDDYPTLATSGVPVIVFLGDYVDRGGESRGVIDLIVNLRRHSGFQVQCLKGNHEQALLQFLDDPTTGPLWAQHGGSATLLSYGVRPPASRLKMTEWQETRDAFAAALPPDHLTFFQSLSLSISIGDYMFVHAGVRHGVGLSQQSEHDLLWIRDTFLNEKRPFEKIIVHGHTPSDQPFSGPFRIGVDTGAYATGFLSAVRLAGAERTFLAARAR